MERITSSGVHSGKAGHPVHYILEMEPGQPHQEAVSLLLRSLYAARRIQRCRYLTMCLPQDRKNDEMRLIEAAECSVGGALVMDLIPDENKIVHYVPSAFEAMNACHAILTHQQQVLFILCLHADESGGSKKVSNALPGIPFVLIQQKNLEDEAARKQLCQMAVDAGVQPDALLFDMLDQSQSGHSLQNLKLLFDDCPSTWRSTCICSPAPACEFRLLRQGRRSAWSSNPNAHEITEGVLERIPFLQGSDIMPRTLVFHNAIRLPNGRWSVRPIPRQNNELSYLVSDAKRYKDFSLNVRNVDDQFIYDCYLSNHILPFYICNAAKALLPIRKEDGRWLVVDEAAMVTYGVGASTAFQSILAASGESAHNPLHT